MKFLSVLLFGFALACSQGESSNNARIADKELMVLEDVPVTGEMFEDDLSGQDEPNEIEQKIIKTARLSFETKDLEVTHNKVLQLTKQYQGFVQSDQSGKGYGQLNSSIIVRVPTENFQKMLEGISEGVNYFDQKEISRQDVTEEFVDLQARLSAKRKLEERYLQVLGQAKNVKEILEIERELSKIREEIEAKEGRLQYLQNKVSLSTIYIDFYKTTKVRGVSISYGQKMTNALKGGWNGISMFFLGVLYIWPILLLIAVFIYFLRRYIKRRTHKKIN